MSKQRPPRARQAQPKKTVPRETQPDVIRPGDFPALEQLLAGYFHQDFRAVHGSPDAAIDAFLADARSRDVRSVAAEWARFKERTAHLSDVQRRQVLTDALGSGWAPRRFADADAALARVAPAATSSRSRQRR